MQDCVQWDAEVSLTQATHRFVKVFCRNAKGVVPLQAGHLTGELIGNARRMKIEPLQHQRHNISSHHQCRLDFATKPVIRAITSFEG